MMHEALNLLKKAPPSADADDLTFGHHHAAAKEGAPSCVVASSRQESSEARAEEEEEEIDVFDFSAWETQHGDDPQAQPRRRMMLSEAEDGDMMLSDAEASDDDIDALGEDLVLGVLDQHRSLSAPASVEGGGGGGTSKYGAAVSGATTPAMRRPLRRRWQRGTTPCLLDESVWALPPLGVAAESLDPSPPPPADAAAARGSARAAVRQLRAPAVHVPAEEEEVRWTPAAPTQPRPAWRRASKPARLAIE